MEIKVIQEKKNALFSRNEVKLEVKAEVTPSKKEAMKMISEKFKVDEKLIRIRDILGKFGVSIFIVTADVYDSAEDFNRIVKKTKQELEAEKKAAEEKKKAEEEEKAAKAAAEGVPSNEEAEGEAKAAAEKPVEEVKEEVKEEIKEEVKEVKEEKKE